MEGLIVLSSELETMVAQMYNNAIPTLWKNKSYPSLQPMASYVADFSLRMEFFESWIEYGKPDVYWISGIFFTHSLLTGALQNYARKCRLPIDVVVYDFEVLATPNEEDVREGPENGMYVRGFYVEGATWDYTQLALAEAAPKVLYGTMPILFFVPVHKEELSVFDHYKCPVYRTPERRGTLATTGHSTNFVMTVRLPSNHKEAHWIKRGTALLTTLAH